MENNTLNGVQPPESAADAAPRAEDCAQDISEGAVCAPVYLLDGHEIHSLEEFREYMAALFERDYAAFIALCHRLTDYDMNLDAEFENWLNALGKRDNIDAWRVNMRA